MSLPSHVPSPPLSSSPSKQSIRRVPSSNAPSRPQSIIDRPATAQQVQGPDQPHDHDHDPYTTTASASGIHHDTLEGDESTRDPPFQPFFTLIEDANSPDYVHPTVHYIFSDDDTDIITEAALRSLEQDQDDSKRKPLDRPVPDDQDEEDPRKESLLPDPIPGVRDNYIILDLHPSTSTSSPAEHHDTSAAPTTTTTAPAPPDQHQHQHQPQSDSHSHSHSQFSITSSHSLTPTWQVLHASLEPAPTFETSSPATATSPQNNSNNNGLMLKIRGTAGMPLLAKEKDKDKDKDRERSGQRLEEMMEQFGKRLDELRLVVEEGEQQQQQEQEQEQQGGDVRFEDMAIDEQQERVLGDVGEEESGLGNSAERGRREQEGEMAVGAS